jgi:hypothetical protein
MIFCHLDAVRPQGRVKVTIYLIVRPSNLHNNGSVVKFVQVKRDHDSKVTTSESILGNPQGMRVRALPTLQGYARAYV